MAGHLQKIYQPNPGRAGSSIRKEVEMDIKFIQTRDLVMKSVLHTAESVASSRAPIFIHGESGTGKELLAKFIHAKSHRGDKPFFAINCAAIPEGLLESELFGYEKGAFTGADQRRAGKFEVATGSSLLLDEISEMPLVLQAKLLRVLQENEVERLGASRPTKIDVRIIAASNRNILEMVRIGKFREDLYYRLNVVPLNLPPLRARTKDIEQLSETFVDISCTENGIVKKALSSEAKLKLTNWSWPGNVRELQNVIERSVLLSKNTVLLDSDILLPDGSNTISADNMVKVGMTVGDIEKMLILKTLDFTAQNRTQAARMLGISIRTLRNKLNEYKIIQPHGGENECSV
jgi:transcriptional regulator with PAS, ATPase and Fis domain